ncbi:MAG: flagellar hook-basal body complex protein FliE [Candidatus Wallbacteria bacterium]|nr:flagellar hook-basal body complex protein FliE [Candidatus Wallbacteria bacterium]
MTLRGDRVITINAWDLQPKEIVPEKSRQTANQHPPTSFGEIFSASLNKVDFLQKTTEQKEKLSLSGELEKAHEMMLDAEKSRIVLDLTVEVRDKLLEAYQTLESMSV